MSRYQTKKQAVKSRYSAWMIEEMKVYQLTHFYENDKFIDSVEIKDLGIYSSKQLAEEAIRRYAKLPGFRSLPLKCFLIGECVVDEDAAWTRGFFASDDLARDFESMSECFDEWLGKRGSIEESWADDNY